MSKALKFGSKLKELRIHLCQKGATSKGVREFIEKYYVNLKNQNPKFPILIRECSQIEPRLWARFEKGKEDSYPLANLSADSILSKIENISK